MKKKMTEDEIRQRIEEKKKEGGRLTCIADEHGKLQNGLKVARLDAGEGHIILKVGTIDQICKAFGIDRPLLDSVIPHMLKVKLGTEVTISDKITDPLTDEKVHLLG